MRTWDDLERMAEDSEDYRRAIGEAIELVAEIRLDLIFRIAVEAAGDSAAALQARLGSEVLPETWAFATPGGACAPSTTCPTASTPTGCATSPRARWTVCR